MDAALRDLVWARAAARCEYCHLPQSVAPVVRFQIEHIRAKQHDGQTIAENLGLQHPASAPHLSPPASLKTFYVVLLLSGRDLRGSPKCARSLLE